VRQGARTIAFIDGRRAAVGASTAFPGRVAERARRPRLGVEI
jgi:hypothetical protein